MNRQLVGTWRLLKHSQFFDPVNGMLIYHPDQTMAVVIHGKIEKAGVTTEQTIAYAGRFTTTEDGYVVHHAKVSDNPARINIPQKKIYDI